MKLGLFLFLIGIYGLILNRKNLILMIISIELILLAVIESTSINNLSFIFPLNSLENYSTDLRSVNP